MLSLQVKIQFTTDSLWTVPQTNLQSPQTLQENHISLKNIIFLLLFSIILILLSSSATYFYFQSKKSSQIPTLSPIPTQSFPSPTPTIDETADWKTFTNQTYKFSFKYPPDSEVITLSPGEREKRCSGGSPECFSKKVVVGLDLRSINKTEAAYDTFYDWAITIQVLDNSNGLDAQKSSDWFSDKSNPILFAGKKAYQGHYVEMHEYEDTWVDLDKDNNLLEIKSHPPAKKNRNISLILSTFRFD